MVRAVLGVVVGFLVLYLLINIELLVAMIGLGIDRVYRPGTYDVSGLWLGVSTVAGIVAALSGGWVCRKIARRPKPVIALASLVAVLGLIMWIVALAYDKESTVRSEGAALWDATEYTRQPDWYQLVNTAVGVFGVLIGGGRPTTRRDPSSAAATDHNADE